MYKIQPKTLFVGKTIKYLPTCHSTNDTCAELLQEGKVQDGFCLYTDNQTKGRGQRGNSWEATANQNITMSIVLFPDFIAASKQFHLNIAVSLAIYRTISNLVENFQEFIPDQLSDSKEKVTPNLRFEDSENFVAAPQNIKIKWPNDLYFENHKIGGILIENTIQGTNLNSTIIGIGLNINQSNFNFSNATSIKKILDLKKDLNLNKIIENILGNIELFYTKLKNGEEKKLKNDYLNHLFRFEEWHYFKKNGLTFKGKITGIDEFGRLQIETEFDLETFGFKEVEFVI